MRFADPQACPDCRGPINGPQCPQCGLDLQDPQIRELWQTLLKADELIGSAVARRDAARFAAPPASPTQPAPPQQPDPYPAFPAPLPRPDAGPKERSWSVGTVLLALGAIGLITAAIIFVSRSWDSIGLVGKALVLAAATAAVIGAAAWVTRRPLRASAEALWAVAFALVALDVGGARGEGLFNLDAVSAPWVVAVAGGVVALLGAAVVRWARPLVSADLVSPSIAAVLGVGAAGAGAVGIGDDTHLFWHVFLGLVVAGVLSLALRFSGSTLIAIGSRIVVAFFYLASAGFAVAEAIDHPALSDLVGDLHGAPLLLVSLAALAVAVAIPVARVLMTAVAITGVGLLVVIPSADAGGVDGGWLAVAALAVVLVVAGAGGSSAWSSGVRWGSLPPVAGLVGLLGWWVTAVLEAGTRALDDVGGFAATDRVQTTARELGVIATVVCAVAIVLVVWVISQWPIPKWTSGGRLPALIAVGAVSLTGVVLSAQAPWWLLATVLVMIAAAAAFAALRPGASVLHVVAAAAALAAIVVSTAVPSVMAVSWVAVGLGCVAVALPGGELWARIGSSIAAVPLVAAGVGAGVDAAGGSWPSATLTALVVSSAGLLATVKVPEAIRRYAESAAGLSLFVAACLPDSVGAAAISWAVVGTVLAIMAMVAGDRGWYAWPSIAAFVVSYVLLVIDTGFSFVEAYTLPPAAAVLAGGMVLLRRRPETPSWVALGPGLALALLPSVPQALADPTGLRALLLGLGAVIVLAIGLRFGQQAPFLLGAGVALLVVLFNIGPYANAAPRVVVISVVSVILVAVGITWEDRVRDGRRVLAFVKEMS